MSPGGVSYQILAIKVIATTGQVLTTCSCTHITLCEIHIIIPILEMRKLRLKQFKCLTQGLKLDGKYFLIMI